VKFQSVISSLGKPVNVAEALVNRSTKWIAKQFDVSIRTAQRWKKGTQQPGKGVGGPGEVMKTANADTRRKVAANAIRNGTTVHVGAVSVQGSSDKKPTTRKINKAWQVTPAMRERMDRAADALERGDMATAEREMNAAVMDRYAGERQAGGRDSSGGLGSFLTITDWGAGFDVT
jgi:hypothetical protein